MAVVTCDRQTNPFSFIVLKFSKAFSAEIRCDRADAGVQTGRVECTFECGDAGYSVVGWRMVTVAK